MVRGCWSGIRNCEVCIYDYSCGTKQCLRSCKKRRTQSSTYLSDDSHSPSDMSDLAAISGLSNAMFDNLSEYDIVESPDPTSPVSVVHYPEFETYSSVYSSHEEDLDDP